MHDIVAEMGPAFLGTRLKRLGERMQASAALVVSDAGLPLQPGHMSVLAALRTGPLSIGRIAELCGSSQPGVTRTVGQMADIGLVTDAPAPDQRSRIVMLTPAGQEVARRTAQDVWPRVGQAAEQLLALAGGDFLNQLAAIEAALAQSSIAERAATLPGAHVRLRNWDPALARAFHDINVEWIETMFALEEADRIVLENPQEKIIDPGGAVLFAEVPGLGIVGTCALKPDDAGGFELTKMGVREAARGLKVGEFLLEMAIARANEMQIKELYLLTNRKCAAAIHLYEKLGFVHDAGVMERHGGGYDRCDVAMLYAGPPRG